MPLKCLETAYPSAVSKSCDYFSRKLKELYQQKGSFYKQTSIPSNASYKVAHRLAKCSLRPKESHTIAEELILPVAVDMVNIMVGESARFSALARLKSKYHSKINMEKDISSLIHDLKKCAAINRARPSTNNCNAVFLSQVIFI